MFGVLAIVEILNYCKFRGRHWSSVWNVDSHIPCVIILLIEDYQLQWSSYLFTVPRAKAQKAWFSHRTLKWLTP